MVSFPNGPQSDDLENLSDFLFLANFPGQFEKDVAEMFGEFCTIANYNTFPCIRWRIIKDEETKNGAADAEDVDKRMREELAKLSKEHEL